MLAWSPSAGDTAQGYQVQRATEPGGPFMTIAAWTENTSHFYTDTHVDNGKTYYYVVAAINQSGTGKNSEPVNATPAAAGPLPTGWAQMDIGQATSPGRASYAAVTGNTFLIHGHGREIGSTADAFSFTYVSVTNDFTFTTRLLTNVTARAGLTMRESLTPGSRALTITVGDTGGRETKFWTRSAIGGVASVQTGNAYSYTPVWYRLQRSGDTFTASQSADGVTWFTIGSSTVAMATNYFAGLAVTGGSTAIFDHVVLLNTEPAQTTLERH